MNPIDIEVKPNKEFFRIKKVVDTLKVQPEYEKDKLRLLSDLALKLIDEIKLKINFDEILGYKFSGTSIVQVKMSEKQIFDETIKALEEHFNTDVAIQNLTALVRFWKEAFNECKIYEPFVEEVEKLLKEFEVIMKEGAELENLKNLLRSKEKFVIELQKQVNSFKADNKILEKTSDYEVEFFKKIGIDLFDNFVQIDGVFSIYNKYSNNLDLKKYLAGFISIYAFLTTSNKTCKKSTLLQYVAINPDDLEYIIEAFKLEKDNPFIQYLRGDERFNLIPQKVDYTFEKAVEIKKGDYKKEGKLTPEELKNKLTEELKGGDKKMKATQEMKIFEQNPEAFFKDNKYDDDVDEGEDNINEADDFLNEEVLEDD